MLINNFIEMNTNLGKYLQQAKMKRMKLEHRGSRLLKLLELEHDPSTQKDHERNALRIVRKPSHINRYSLNGESLTQNYSFQMRWNLQSSPYGNSLTKLCKYSGIRIRKYLAKDRPKGHNI